MAAPLLCQSLWFPPHSTEAVTGSRCHTAHLYPLTKSLRLLPRGTCCRPPAKPTHTPMGSGGSLVAGGEDQTSSLVCREGEALLNTSQCTGWPHITERPSCAKGERSPAPDQKTVPAIPPSLVQVEGTRSPSAALDKHATLGIQSPGAAGAGRAMQNLGILPPNCGILPLEENGEAGLEKT